MPEHPGPDISVILCTYNHEPFVAHAIDTVLTQHTEYTFELIISEDASTDRTTDIVREAASRDPRIRLFLSPVNLRSNEVVARGIRAARGRYMCLLDGDDHWLVRDKLERQARLLDHHLDASACFHNALIVRDGMETSDTRWTPATQPYRTNSFDIWRGNPFATAAGMIRTASLFRLGRWYEAMFPITDWPLYILSSETGDLLFIDEPVAAYRLHEGGMFTSLPGRAKLDMISRTYRAMDEAFEGHRRLHARNGSRDYFLGWAERYFGLGDRKEAWHCLKLAIRTGGIPFGISPARRWVRAIGCGTGWR
ncbi:glycosyltransferase [Sphingobium phenoxybenzoativorans]|uniref:Glycosyltransferase n=1 Tax=Sphingobium phenoxybenzoativorans TaxID=1592790 RepID=A0A975K6G5_9SPHN|nr:glycosyltransferase [Sphingobium phenoxybenzoativorans]QUT05686.1 glycosyltransferase [Sphingobium phenoxybenzoativorans]